MPTELKIVKVNLMACTVSFIKLFDSDVHRHLIIVVIKVTVFDC